MYHFRPADLPDTVLSDTEIFLAKLLHHFMRVTYYNTHEITTTEEDDVADGLGPDKLQVAISPITFYNNCSEKLDHFLHL